MKRRGLLILGLGGLTLAACVMGPSAYTPSPRAQQELAMALQGRVMGPPQACISSTASTQMQVIDDATLLYHDGRTVYVQHPRSPCSGLAMGSYTLVTRKFGTSQNCDGDINHLVDLRSGMQGGACVFGPFVPYTKPR